MTDDSRLGMPLTVVGTDDVDVVGKTMFWLGWFSGSVITRSKNHTSIPCWRRPC